MTGAAVPLQQPQAAAGSKKRARSAAHAASGAAAGPTYRGVSQHRSGLRWEAHVWKDNRQIYLGGSAQPEVAALAFDLVSGAGERGASSCPCPAACNTAARGPAAAPAQQPAALPPPVRNPAAPGPQPLPLHHCRIWSASRSPPPYCRRASTSAESRPTPTCRCGPTLLPSCGPRAR